MFRNLSAFLVITGIVIGSCKKSNAGGGAAALNIIHAEIGVPSLYAYFTYADSAFYMQNSSISYGSSMEYGVSSGVNYVSLVSTSDTTKPLFQSSFQFKPGGIYSLYLAGVYPAIDTLFMQDNISSHTDSVSSVRFVNLSKASGPLTINLTGNDPSQAEFPSLGYKEISAFKNYPANGDISSYNFEVRDKVTGNLLTVFNWSLAVFKNQTLVINGSEDPSSTTPIGVFQVNNY